MKGKKLLFITTSFPPDGGPGVQRNVKFAKYWPKYGWKPFFLTPKEVFYSTKDPGLLREVHPDTEVIRTNTLDPRRLIFLLTNKKTNNVSAKNKEKKRGTSEQSLVFRLYTFIRDWFFIPDVGILWLPFALVKGRKIVKKEGIDVIVGSCPGASNIIISYLLSRMVKVPFVLDFRDGWMDYPYHKFPTKLHENINWWLEKKTLPKAAKFITYGTYLTNKLKDRYDIPSDRFVEIPNGFDYSDFKDLSPKFKKCNSVRIVHSGAIYAARRQVFENLLKGFSKLPDHYKSRMVFDFVGTVYDGADDFIRSLGIEENVNFYGYQSHAECMNFLASADATLILLPKGDYAAFTGKVFEYIAVGKTILELGEPTGSCGLLLKEIFEENPVAHPDDEENIIRVLKLAVDKRGQEIPEEVKAPFSRESQAEAFLRVIDNI